MFISSRCAAQARLPSRTGTSQPGQPHGTIVSGLSVGSFSRVTAPSLPSEVRQGLPIAPGVPLKHQGSSPSTPATSGGEREANAAKRAKDADTAGPDGRRTQPDGRRPKPAGRQGRREARAEAAKTERPKADLSGGAPARGESTDERVAGREGRRKQPDVWTYYRVRRRQISARVFDLPGAD
jgi:hypothetical protein